MDSARSWAVAVACAWINFFTFALVRSAALVFASLLRNFPVTREQASWPVNLTFACLFFSGTIAGVLARHIAVWKLNLFGCLGGSLAVAACFFAPSVLFLNIFLGVIQGTCIGLLNLFNVVINQHFLKHRAMASGISNAGFTMAGLVFPPVVQALEDRYGLRGTFLICGAIMLNSVAGTFLQRTPPQAQPKEAPLRNPGEEKYATASASNSVESSTDKHKDRQPNETECTNFNLPLNHENTKSCRSNSSPELCYEEVKLLPEKEDRPGGNINFKDRREETAHVLEADCGRPIVKNSASEKAHSKKKLKEDILQSSCKEDSTSTKKCAFLSFLLLPKFYLFSLGFSLIHFNMATYFTVVVDFGADSGISRWKAVYLITVYCVTDLLARLGSGWITDRKHLRKSTMMWSHLMLWGTSLCLMPMSSSYPFQVALSILSGWCTGSTLILIPVLFMELVSMEKFGVCFGIGTSFVGAAGLARPLLIGLYRDTRGDYEGLFRLIGGVTLCMSLPWLYYCVKQRCSY